MRVFVYGTLKQGGRLSGYLHDSQFLGRGKISADAGLCMLSLVGFPALIKVDDIEDATDIHGEVYDIDDYTLDWLDRVERGYTRELGEIEMAEGTVEAFYYYIHRKIVLRNCSKVGSGFWNVDKPNSAWYTT